MIETVSRRSRKYSARHRLRRVARLLNDVANLVKDQAKQHYEMKKKNIYIESMVKGGKREVKIALIVNVGVTLRGKYSLFFTVDVVYGDVIICHWDHHC